MADGQIADKTDDDRNHQNARGADADEKGPLSFPLKIRFEDMIFFLYQFRFQIIIFQLFQDL